MKARLIFALTVAASLMAGPLATNMGAQASGNYLYNKQEFNPNYRYNNPGIDNSIKGDPSTNSIVLEADVMINVPAKSYIAIFSSVQNGETVSATDSLMNRRIQRFMVEMKKHGIADKNIHIDFISLVPTYSMEFASKVFSNTANEVPTGFEMKKNIHVIFHDHSQLDRIITGAAKAEIYDLVKVDYNVENSMKAYDSLRNQAQQIIEQKRKMYAKMGLETKVVNLTEGYNCAYPMERYTSYTAFKTGVSKNDLKKVNPNATVNELPKSTTVYYNMIPPNQFDMVINPDCVEPVVQYYYKLKVRLEVSLKKETPVKTTASK